MFANGDIKLLAAPTLPGDYNGDHVVDAADYTVWRDNLGTMNVLPNDSIGGEIGSGQYDQWKTNFGTGRPGLRWRIGRGRSRARFDRAGSWRRVAVRWRWQGVDLASEVAVRLTTIMIRLVHIQSDWPWPRRCLLRCRMLLLATDYYWDTNGASSGIGSVGGGAASWLTSSWATGSSGTLSTGGWPNTQPQLGRAVFQGTAGTVNISSRRECKHTAVSDSRLHDRLDGWRTCVWRHRSDD